MHLLELHRLVQAQCILSSHFLSAGQMITTSAENQSSSQHEIPDDVTGPENAAEAFYLCYITVSARDVTRFLGACCQLCYFSPMRDMDTRFFMQYSFLRRGQPVHAALVSATVSFRNMGVSGVTTSAEGSRVVTGCKVTV